MGGGGVGRRICLSERRQGNVLETKTLPIWVLNAGGPVVPAQEGTFLSLVS